MVHIIRDGHFGFRKFSLRKKVSVSVSIIWSRKKVLVSVSENLVSVSVKIFVSSFSAHHVFLSADFPMEEECYGEEKMAILAIGATILKMFFAVQGCKINDYQEL